MAVTKLSNSGIKTGVLKYDSMLAGNAAFDPAATWLIQRVAGTGSSATITFSNIPQTYQHLQLRWISKNTGTVEGIQTISVQFNSDTAGNYITHYLRGNGSTASATSSSTSETNISLLAAGTTNSTSLSNTMGAGILDIHDYKSTTKNKTIRSFYGNDANIASTDFRATLASGLWINTSAITSITLTSSANNFTTSSSFALYGFKGA